jgi:hypothetical protein
LINADGLLLLIEGANKETTFDVTSLIGFPPNRSTRASFSPDGEWMTVIAQTKPHPTQPNAFSGIFDLFTVNRDLKSFRRITKYGDGPVDWDDISSHGVRFGGFMADGRIVHTKSDNQNDVSVVRRPLLVSTDATGENRVESFVGDFRFESAAPVLPQVLLSNQNFSSYVVFDYSSGKTYPIVDFPEVTASTPFVYVVWSKDGTDLLLRYGDRVIGTKITPQLFIVDSQGRTRREITSIEDGKQTWTSYGCWPTTDPLC